MQTRGRVQEWACGKHSKVGGRTRTHDKRYFCLGSRAIAEVAFLRRVFRKRMEGGRHQGKKDEGSSDRPNCPSGACCPPKHLQADRSRGLAIKEEIGVARHWVMISHPLIYAQSRLIRRQDKSRRVDCSTATNKRRRRESGGQRRQAIDHLGRTSVVAFSCLGVISAQWGGRRELVGREGTRIPLWEGSARIF